MHTQHEFVVNIKPTPIKWDSIKKNNDVHKDEFLIFWLVAAKIPYMMWPLYERSRACRLFLHLGHYDCTAVYWCHYIYPNVTAGEYKCMLYTATEKQILHIGLCCFYKRYQCERVWIWHNGKSNLEVRSTHNALHQPAVGNQWQ